MIVGGGIVGASIAYHLALSGESDVTLVERGRLANGTTWHAAGLVSQVRGTHALTELSRINVETYERVARETGIDPGFRQVGSLTVARTEERFHEIRRPVSIARDTGLPWEIVDRGRIRELWPEARRRRPRGWRVLPRRRHDQPGAATLALARAAVDRGVRYVPGTTVTGFRRGPDGRRVTGITTSAGDLEAEVVVLAAGLWTSELARLADAERRALSGRARLGHDRRDAGRDRGPAVPARPRRLPVHPPSRWPVRARRVRAERQAVGAIGRADRRLRRARARLGPHGPGADGGPRARPRLGRSRVRALPARAGELHAGCQPPARFRPGGAGALRRRGAELAGDHLRAGRREGGGRVDPGRAHDDGSRRDRRRPDGSMGEPATLAPRADGRDARRPLRDALAGEAARDGPRGASTAARRRVPGGRRGDGPGRRLGAAVVVRAWRRAGVPRTIPTPIRRGSRPSATRSGRRARASPCTTSRRTPSSRSPARARGPASSDWSRPTSTSRRAGSSTRSSPTSVAGS